jgi:hypothetical protein
MSKCSCGCDSRAVQVAIDYPQEGTKAIYNNPFVVLGYSQPGTDADLTARILFQAHGGQILTFFGSPVSGPPFPYDWAFTFYFETVDNPLDSHGNPAPVVNVVDLHGPAKLIVEATDSYGNMGRAVRHFGLVPAPVTAYPHVKGKASTPPSVIIANCQDDGTSFFIGVYAKACTGHHLVSCTAKLTNPTPASGANGSPVPVPPLYDYDYYFSFSNVTPNQPFQDYTLQVDCTDDQPKTTTKTCILNVS